MTAPVDLAKAVLQYLAIREENPLGAARIREGRFRALADAVLAEKPAPVPLHQWTPSGCIPLAIRPDNQNQPEERA